MKKWLYTEFVWPIYGRDRSVLLLWGIPKRYTKDKEMELKKIKWPKLLKSVDFLLMER